MFLYGCLRDDFAVILGPLIAYYIYMESEQKGPLEKVELASPPGRFHDSRDGHLVFTQRCKHIRGAFLP